MIYISPGIGIQEDEIEEHFIRASGPGGQNVNKVATAVQLRFDIENSPSLPGDVRSRLRSLAGNRITDKGIIIINAQRFRSQERNRKDAQDRLIAIIRKAAIKPKHRRKSFPTVASRQRRLDLKHHRSRIKRSRQKPGPDD